MIRCGVFYVEYAISIDEDAFYSTIQNTVFSGLLSIKKDNLSIFFVRFVPSGSEAVITARYELSILFVRFIH